MWARFSLAAVPLLASQRRVQINFRLIYGSLELIISNDPVPLRLPNRVEGCNIASHIFHGSRLKLCIKYTKLPYHFFPVARTVLSQSLSSRLGKRN